MSFRKIEWIALAVSVLVLSASIASARGGGYGGERGGFGGGGSEGFREDRSQSFHGGGGGFRDGGEAFHSAGPVMHQNSSMGFNISENTMRSIMPYSFGRDSIVRHSVVANNGFGESRALSIERGRTFENPVGVSRPEMNTQHLMNNQLETRNNMNLNSGSNHQFAGQRLFGNDHRELFHPIVSPRDRFDVDFHHGHEVFHRHFFPFYHRRDVFVSFFGFWPDYDCLRYYWYGYQPFYWYGYEPYLWYGGGYPYPVTYDTGGTTNNYYTYNYGNTEPVTQTPPAIEDESYPPPNPPQEQQIDKGPAPATSTDRLFNDAVNAFGTGDYKQAADKLAAAMQQSPNDIVMPFAYVQALFAQCKYSEAAAAFRSAMEKASMTQKHQAQVFFPHGLYMNDDVLNQQIKALQDVVRDNPQNTDFQLMLGYQLLGAGRASEAIAPLKTATQDKANTGACNVLLGLAQKTNAETPDGIGK